MKLSHWVAVLGASFARFPRAARSLNFVNAGRRAWPLAATALALGFTAQNIAAQTVVFNDTFGAGSTINNTTPTPANPSYGATAYQGIATKALNTGTPSIASGHLRFGIVSTSSGINQIQALFTKNPVTLTNVGDYIELTVVFTDEAGVFNTTANNAMMIGLYNGGQHQPYAGGQTNTSTALTGGAEGWIGYVGRVYVSGSSSNSNALLARAAQSTSTASNQDLIFTSGFFTSAGTTSNAAEPAALTVGSQYTEVFRITMASSTTLTLAHSLYSGSGTSGTQLFTQSTTTSAILTAVYDGLALGYRAAGAATIFDVNAVKVVTTGSVVVVPQILTQPLGQTRTVGDAVTLTVVADGGSGTALSYQWKKGGMDIPSATSATYSIPSVTLGDAGDYTVVVTDAAGSTTSNTATLIVSGGAVAPQILTQPTGATLLVGAAQTFSFTASGTEPLTYRWQYSADGVVAYNDISGATSTSYTIGSVAISDSGYYQAVVTNAQGSATTTPVQLVVNQTPAIATQPTGATLHVGDPLSLSVTATGAPAPGYQWMLNGVAISGATSATYSVGSVTGANTGTYSVVVTNSVGSVTSNAVSVAVLSSSMTASAMTPGNGASSILPDTPLTITFNTTPSLGTGGTFRIYDASNDSLVDSIDLIAATTLKNTLRTASSLSALNLPVANKTIGGATNWNYYPFTISGNTVTLYPKNGALARGKSYYVQVDPGVFLDSSGLSFGGIADKTTWTFSTTSATPASPTYLTVAADGSGDFYTVQAAVDYVAAGNTTPTTIYIKNGTYFEMVYWTGKHNLTFVGQDSTLTKIVYPTNNNFNGGGSSYHRGTFYGQTVHDIVIANLTIQNSTPQGGSQAEALILTGSNTSGVQTGRNIVTAVKLYSYQDTVQINGQCYLSDSYVEGDVDFIWGTGPVFVSNCDIHMKARTGTPGYFTQIRNPSTNHGYVFSGCRFTADAGQTGTAMGRIDPNLNQFPYSEVVLLNCVFGDAGNDNFLNTSIGASGSNFWGGWWLLNNVTSDVSSTTAANVHDWDYNTLDYLGATPTFAASGTRPAFTIMPTDSTTLAHYADPTWVLGTSIAGVVNTTWTPALTPVIVAQPVSVQVTSGSSASFSVSVTAIPAATYQWQKDGQAISGATSATYTIAAASSADAGSYTVVVTNSAGSVTSVAATLAITTQTVAPTITTQPQGQTVNLGSSASFTVVAAGTAPLSYQWQLNGADVSGATAATLTIASVQALDAGNYTVTVSNSAGSVTSSAATLTVTLPPAAPTATAATALSVSGFTANWTTASGATDYHLDVSTSNSFATFVSGYQDLDAGNLTSAAVTSLSAGTTYYYRVRAANGAGTSASSNTITVMTIPAAVNISIVNSGSTAGSVYSLGDVAYAQNFDALPASGTFTWYNGATLPGWYAAPATGSLNTTAVTSDGSGNLADQTLASVGTASSNERALAYHTRVSTTPTYIGLGFSNNSGRALNSFTLSYTPEQWRESGSQRDLTLTVQYLIGATATDLNGTSGWTTISGLGFTTLNGSVGATATLSAMLPVTIPAGSSIWFRWVTSNSAATSTSSNDILAIDNVTVAFAAPADGTPAITTQPTAQNVVQGASVSFTVVASGDAPLTYQWRKDGAPISGATSDTYAIAAAQTTDAGAYTVVVSNAKGSATSASAALTVTVPNPPSITTQPQAQTVTVGDNVSFSVVATGPGTLTYQWKHDGNIVASATAATLSLTGVQMSDAGAYTVDVTNAFGTVTSDSAVLTVQAVVAQAPSITTQPAAQSVTVGANVSFSVVASGTSPLSYQWYKGSNAITNATAATLSLTNVQLSDAGSYSVVVTNSVGSVTSDIATLAVASALPVEEFNLTGFATQGSGTTGGGVIADTDAAYRKCYTPQDFVQAVADANKTAGAVKVIEIMNDLSLGWNEVGATVQAIASNPLRSHNAPKLHPVLLVTGVSLLDIKPKSPLTIFSANGATIKHVNFNIKGTSNVIIRNLKFDEMWEWDEASKGNYDDNDWDFITIGNGGAATNIWIDHCTFTKAYDGIIDQKAGTQYVTISWCKYVGDDGATNPNSWVRQQITALEANRASYPFYNFLRNNGFSVEDIVQIIQGHDKTHLMGSNDLDPGNATLSATFHHLWLNNLWDRCVPRLRAGNVHVYNVYAYDTDVLAAKRLRDTRANAMTTSARNTLNNTYSFNPPINGCISTEGGALLLEKSVYVDCLWPLRNNQTDPSNSTYTGKIMALDSIYTFHNTDGSVVNVQGNSTDAANPMGPFQAAIIPFSWNLTNNQLPYAYTPDAAAQVPAIVAQGAGAGVLTWSKSNWLQTAYASNASQAPSILGQPQSQSVGTGVDATFTVQANGAAPLSYQWMKDGGNLADGGRITGSTTAVLTVAAATLADAGNYTVVVSNSSGSATSDAATLTVVPASAPSITTQPTSQSAAIGTTVNLSVVAGGTAPFTYQWTKDGNAIVGATGATLSLTNVQLTDGGSYAVTVTNGVGSIASNAAVVTVGNVPATPVAVAATGATSGGFTANWNAASDASDYHLDVSASSAFDSFVSGYQDLDVGNTLTANVTGLTASTTYYYRVRGYNTFGGSASSNAVPVTTQAISVPPTPVTIFNETFPLASATYSTGPTINDSLAVDANSFPTPTATQAAWASFGTANIPYVNGTSLALSASTNARGLLAYFEPSTAVASIAVGETITATVTFSFTGGTPASNPGNFRLALLNSGGNDTATNNTGISARYAAGVSSSLTNSNTARAYSGYVVDSEASTALTTNTLSFWARVPANSPTGGSAQLIGPTGTSDIAASSTFVQVGTAGGGTVGVLNNDGTHYVATFSITRTSATQMDLSYVVTNGGTTVMAYAASQTSGTLYTSFDSFALLDTYGAAPTIYGLTIAKSAAAAAVAPTITVQPTGQTVVAGTDVTLSVAATGTSPLTYVWKKDGATVSGATSATLLLPGVTAASAGNYTVTVSNTAGSVTSDAAALVVNVPVSITTQPQSQSVTAGTNVTFSVVAAGTAPLTYQWQHAGIDIQGATSSTLSLTNVQDADAGDYTVVVGNVVNSVTSAAATLGVTDVAQPPSITTQPQAQTVTLGNSATFSVVATGTAPLSYQWSKDGAPIQGATAATFTLPSVLPTDAGNYTVVVTNSVSTVTSDAAALTVNVPAPTISLHPKSTKALTGSRVSFSVFATGYHPTYQWNKNGTPIQNATGLSLQLSNLQASDAADYTVTVSTSGGSITSNAATLTLDTPAATLPTQPTIPAAVFKVTDYGAVGDGTTVNTTAIAAAITAAKNAGGGTVEIPPAVGAYLSGPMTLASNLNLQIDAGATLRMLPYQQFPTNQHFINIPSGSSNVAITGGGTIEGDGSAWWTAYDSNNSLFRPRMIQSSRVTNFLISGLTLQNSPMFHIAFSTSAANVTIYGVTITAPSTSPNTDGIDPAGSNMLIQGCSIAVGDDNIAVKADSLCSNITIANCAFGVGHGLSVGGQTTTGLNGMTVKNCTFNGTSVGLRLKADPTQGGPVQNLTYSDLTMTNVPSPIVFYSYYNIVGSPGATSGSSQTTPAKVLADNATPPNTLASSTIPTWKNITIHNLTATGATAYSILWGLPLADGLIANVTLDNVSVTGGLGLEIYDATNVQFTGTTSFSGITTANALAIIGQPQPQTVAAGGSATFTVTAAGTSGVSATAPTYQWSLNGMALTDGTQTDASIVAGATTATLTVSNLNAANIGNYTCTVSNNLDGYNVSGSTLAAGSLPVSATSSPAMLTVTGAPPVAPIITAQPLSQTVRAGTNVTFQVTAYSTLDVTYQWQHDGANITGATSATLALPAVQAADGGTYQVLVTNSVGTTTSNAVTLTVNALPANTSSVLHDVFDVSSINAGLSNDTNGFLAPTATQAAWYGGGAALNYATGGVSVSAGSRGLLAYFTPSTSQVTLAVGETLRATAAFKFAGGTGVSATGDFRMGLLYSNGNGTGFNDGATTNPRPTGESIPASRITTDNFSLTNGGNTPRGYSGYLVDTTAAATASTDTLSFWRRDGGEGKSQQWLGPTGADIGANATFSQVGVTGGGAVGAIMNNSTVYVATLTVTRTSPTVTTLTYAVTNSDGSSTIMGYTTTETSDTPLTSFDSFMILSTYNASLTVTDLNVTKTAAAPTILTQPADQLKAIGANAVFTVSADGTAPLAYQWYKDGVALADGGNISGSTTATLTVSTIGVNDQGSYTVTVTNDVGSATSSGAALTAVVTPAITWASPAPITYGTALDGTQLNATATVPGTFVYTPVAGTVLNAGKQQTLSVTFTPTDTTRYAVASASVLIDVDQAAAQVALSGLAATYDGTSKAVTATTTPSDLNTTITYDGSATAPTNAGNYAVVATVTDPNYVGSGSGTLAIAKATAVVSIAQTAPTYDGAPKTATVTTTPADLKVDITYDGGATPPTNGGAHMVVATVDDPNYSGSASTTLVIAPASQTVNFAALPASIYVGVPFTVSATASSGLTPVTYTITSGSASVDGNVVTALGAGSITVRATQGGNNNYNLATADISFSALKQSQSITFAPPTSVTAAQTALTLTATATSGLPVSFTLVSGPATLSGTTLTLTGDTGTIVVRASQAGNGTYSAAADAEASITVTPATVKPQIVTQPQSQTVEVDAAVSLSVQATGTPTPTYQWWKDGRPIAGATSATYTIASAQLTDAGSYTVLVSNSAGQVTSSAAQLTVKVHSYAGVYFGQFASGSTWALNIGDDNTGTFISYLADRKSALVLTLTVNPDGTFEVTGSEIKPTATARAAAAVTSEAGLIASPRIVSLPFTLSGRITGGSVTGQVTGLDETLQGTADTTGSAATVAGLYTASAIGTNEGTTYTIIGASGQAVVVTTTSSVVAGGSGTVNSSGQITVTSSDSTQITVTVNASSQSVAASVTPAGSSTPITFAGVSDTVTPDTRIVNLSVRGDAGKDDATLIMGFVVSGSGSENVLVRGIGPGLVPQGVTASLVLPDPRLKLFNNATGTVLAQNDDWGATPNIATTFQQVGAFALAANSKDSALLTSLNAGLYSAHATSIDATTGIAMIEVYDASFAADTRLVNVSARGVAKTGDDILIAGFVLSGNAPKKILIRGVGPSLVPQGVSAASVLADPKITLYSGSTVIATNDNWGGTTALKSVFSTVGAFTLTSDTSADAALLVTLQPGIYTVHATGVNNTTGVVLIEIYDVP